MTIKINTVYFFYQFLTPKPPNGGLWVELRSFYG